MLKQNLGQTIIACAFMNNYYCHTQQVQLSTAVEMSYNPITWLLRQNAVNKQNTNGLWD